MTSTPAPPNPFAAATALVLVLACATGAVAAVLLFVGVVGHQDSQLCGADDATSQDACSIDVEANQRQTKLFLTLGAASGLATVMLSCGALVTATAGPKRS